MMTESARPARSESAFAVRMLRTMMRSACTRYDWQVIEDIARETLRDGKPDKLERERLELMAAKSHMEVTKGWEPTRHPRNQVRRREFQPDGTEARLGIMRYWGDSEMDGGLLALVYPIHLTDEEITQDFGTYHGNSEGVPVYGNIDCTGRFFSDRITIRRTKGHVLVEQRWGYDV